MGEKIKLDKQSNKLKMLLIGAPENRRVQR